jgi:SAM-dependent methyltransferase
MRTMLRTLKKKFKNKYKNMTTTKQQEDLLHWFKDQYGKYLITEESKILKEIFANIYSHRMLQLGDTSHQLLKFPSNHLHEFSFGLSSKCIGNNAISEPHLLPLSSETIDTILLHHSIELSKDPHETLKEASRVLKSSGHMIIVVFNPMSLFGLFKFSAKFFSYNPIWQSHNIRYKRLIDWLKFLNIKPIKRYSGGYFISTKSFEDQKNDLSFNNNIKKNHFMFGAFYIVVAKKYVPRPVFPDYADWKKINIATISHKKSLSEIKSNQTKEYTT